MMFQHFPRWGRSGRKSRRRVQRQAPRRLTLEALEERCVLTSTLYVDFGDRFTGGILTGTVGALQSTVAPGSATDVNGPQLADDNFVPFSNATQFTLTSYNSVYGGAAGAQRTTIMEYVRRFYEPFDVTVVELTAAAQIVNGVSVRGAANLNDVSLTLDANEGATKNNDAYVLVGLIEIGPQRYNPALSAYGGIADLDDLLARSNLRDDTALALIAGTFQSVEFTANTIAHEAAHNFGLRHTFGNSPSTPPFGSNITAELYESDIMSYLSTSLVSDSGGFNVFSRFPLAIGDGNTSNLVRSAVPTPYDQMANDANIGAAVGVSYVTGTGLYDVITVTRIDATTANVNVQPFRNANFTGTIIVPGTTAATSYSYTVNTANRLLIDGGARSDRFIIDATLGSSITVRGMSGIPGGLEDVDSLIVNGNGSASAVYAPGTANLTGIDGHTDWRGTLTIGATNIQFQEFDVGSTVTVGGITTVTVQTGSSGDSLILDNFGASQSRVRGNNGAAQIVPLLFSGITNLAIDSGVGADSLQLAAVLTATSLQNVTFNSGDGDDSLTANLNSFVLPVGGGAITFNGGNGAGDVINVSNDVATMTLNAASLVSSGGGSITLSGVETANLTGGAGNNAFVTNGWAGNVNVVGGAGTDTLQVFGNAAATGLYVPGAAASNGFVGNLNVGTMALTFAQFEAASTITLQDVVSLTMRTPNGADALTLDVPVGGRSRVAGTTGGVTFVPLTFFNVTNMTIDSATADGSSEADTIFVAATPAGTGLQNLTISTGAGDDQFFLPLNSFALPGGGAFRLNAGAGSDLLRIVNDVAQMTLATTSVAILGGGALTLDGLFDTADLQGGVGNNLLAVNSWVGLVTLTGNAGDDTFRLGGDGAVAGNLDNIVGSVTVGAGSGANDRIVINDNLNAAAVTYDVNVVDDAFGSMFDSGVGRAFLGLTYDGAATESFALNANTATNLIRTAPSTTTTFLIDGNAPAVADGDYLLMDFYGTLGRKLDAAGVVLPPGYSRSWTFANRQSVFFTRVEQVNNFFAFGSVGVDGGRDKGNDSRPWVKVVDLISNQTFEFLAYEPTYRYGVQVAMADMNNDGEEDIIVVPGRLRAPEIRVFVKTSPLSFTWVEDVRFRRLAYAANNLNGVNLAVGDFNNDTFTDVVVAPMRGAPEIRVFLNLAGAGLEASPTHHFFAFATKFIGGASVAVGDLDNNGVNDVVVGTGGGQAAQVLVFRLSDLTYTPAGGSTVATPFKKYANFFSPKYFGGVNVSVGHVNNVGNLATVGDDVLDIIVSQGKGGQSLITVLDGASGNRIAGSVYAPTTLLFGPYTAYTDRYNNAAVYVAPRDVDGDGVIDFLYTGQSSDGRTKGVIKFFSTNGTLSVRTVFPMAGVEVFPGFRIG